MSDGYHAPKYPDSIPRISHPAQKENIPGFGVPNQEKERMIGHEIDGIRVMSGHTGQADGHGGGGGSLGAFFEDIDEALVDNLGNEQVRAAGHA